MKAKAVILASRPGADGEPRMENFKVQEQEVVEEPPEGHVVLKTIYLSVDPYMRCRMNEDPGTDYLSAWTVGGVAEGGGVGVVLSSRGEGLSPGDVVTSFSWPWQTHAVLPASGLQKLAPAWLAERPSLALGAVGMPGLTALLGLRTGGHIEPRGGQALVVSGAAGACGHLVGQMNVGGHVVLCGQISQYNKDVPYPPPLPLHTQTVLQERNISRDRFLVLNYPDKHAEGLQQLASWVQSGQLKVKETIMDGIENVGAAFVSMMQGGNIGKQLVLVSPL
ncbi:prostaglandin reductase 2 isoform X2 [Petromyzon marinus]|uniref:15-oxoprostaglandin 13-reductase n=1 Tax=Petromyzon marinus TaxID=7757 RepID=A0AAJ7TN57_PETMA|nr:prostaglandin reductase 2 isoform X2 [Petromyzon marinus]